MPITRENKLAILMMSLSLIVTLGLCEISLRFLVFSDSFAISGLRQAWRYADGTYEDEYWKLKHIFDGSPEMTNTAV